MHSQTETHKPDHAVKCHHARIQILTAACSGLWSLCVHDLYKLHPPLILCYNIGTTPMLGSQPDPLFLDWEGGLRDCCVLQGDDSETVGRPVYCCCVNKVLSCLNLKGQVVVGGGAEFLLQ